MADITMPQLGETVTEGTITKWFKQVGDTVVEDEVLFEVSTDKVDSEVPSPITGVLAEIRAAEGDIVEVGEVVAVLGDSASGTLAEPAPAEAPAAEPADTEPPPGALPPPPPSAAPPPPPAEPAPAAPAAKLQQATPGGAEEFVLSPVVRRLINDHGLDPGTITGTGQGGRITRADVEAVVRQRGDGTGPAKRAGGARAGSPGSPPAATRPRTSERDTVVPLNNIRRLTGEYMVASKATSPHVLTAVEVDFEGVERVRRAHRAEFKAEEGFSLTYLPFIARAVCDAVHEYPHINATVGDGELVVHNYVNLAIAVDLDFKGLVAPVLRDAESKRLTAIAREVVDLADRARSKRLTPDDISGGTFTITNPGQWGTLMQFPIINQPQVAILSTDGIRRKPVVVTDAAGNEAIGIHSVGILALAWDHRAFDGAYVAAFMDHLRSIIETRDWEAEMS